ncbi:MAG: DUF1385 domain-containing protein [Acidobacteria bacterium]|nr:DUF1385 domain-containing protein [Acidobacteriota bacterium]
MRRPNLGAEEILVGGQAVIEGVLMRTPIAYAVAVRRADGTIAFQRGTVRPLSDFLPWLKWPIVRGVAVLFQSLALGVQALHFSASAALEGAEGPRLSHRRKSELSSLALAGTLVLSLALGIGLFVYAPLVLARGIGRLSAAVDSSWMLFNLVDGVLRVVFFLGYVLAISRMKDIRRVFQYHGAEHKVVYTWEAGEELTVENARRKSPLHPRCGTSFLLFVMVTSILVFSLAKVEHLAALLAVRLFLLPLIAGLSYELIRTSARNQKSAFFRWLIAPGLWLQKLTTQEPSDDQLEVAIAALQEAILLSEEQPVWFAQPVAALPSSCA